MVQITKKIGVFVSAASLLLVLSLNSSAEESDPKTQVCLKYDHIATWSSSFCLNSISLLKDSWKATGADASEEALALGLLPFVGLRIELNPKTFLMIEAEQIASYEFDETIPFVSEDDINVEWMGIAGVRFFFFDWLALDTGVMYRSDYHGIGDAHIQAGLNVSLSLPKVAKSLWGER